MQLKRAFVIGALFTLAQAAIAQAPVVGISPTPKLQFLDNNGKPLAGGCVATYAAGTTTPLATYTDFTGTVTNPNPVVLDSSGRASIWIASPSIKYVVKQKSAGGNCSMTFGTILYTTDGVRDTGLQLGVDLSSSMPGQGASLISLVQPGGVPTTVGAALASTPLANQYMNLSAAVAQWTGTGQTLELPPQIYPVTSQISLSGLELRCQPGAVIQARSSNITLLSMGTGASLSGKCIIDGNSLANVTMVAANGTNISIDGATFRNGQGNGVSITGASTAISVKNSSFLNFGNGTQCTGAGCDSTMVLALDFTSITLADDYFNGNSSSDFVHILNTSSSPENASLITHGLRGTGIGRIAMEVQLTTGTYQSTDDHFDTILPATLSAGVFTECMSVGVVQGSTPAAPSGSPVSIKGLYCEVPAWTNTSAANAYCLELYANGANVNGLQCIGAWARGLVMGSADLQLSNAFFYHVGLGIIDLGTLAGSGHPTNALRMRNVIFKETKQEDLAIGNWDASNYDLEYRSERTPCAWASDTSSTWYSLAIGASGGVTTPAPWRIAGDVTVNAAACAGFGVTAMGLFGPQPVGSVFETRYTNLGAAPFGTVFFQNGGNYFNGMSLKNGVYTNAASIGTYTGGNTLVYQNNVCGQGANPNACGAAGGPAIDGTVTPTLFSYLTLFAPGTCNYASDLKVYSDLSLAGSGAGGQYCNQAGAFKGTFIPAAVTSTTNGANVSATAYGTQTDGIVYVTVGAGGTPANTLLVTLGANQFSSAPGSPSCTVGWASNGSGIPAGAPFIVAAPSSVQIFASGALAAGTYFASFHCR